MSEEQKEKLEPNPEHLAKLKEGVEVWNMWYAEQRKINGNFRAQLDGADLSYIHLQDVDLYSANLQGADLYNANLQGADLYSANLQGADLSYINLQGADLNYSKLVVGMLRSADLKGANFQKADLQGANLQDADLQGANLGATNLQDAKLHFTNLQDTNLYNANLQGAEFKYANLQGANLENANLINVNLAYSKNILFSDNKIKDAVITSTTTAPWLTLKKSYTNTMMLFTLAAVFAFFLPYVVNIAVWRGVNFSQELTSNMQTSLVNEEIKNMTKCFSDNAAPCDKWRIWQLVLGRHRENSGVLFALLSVILIAYNLLRIYLTQQVSILRDSEQATGLTPRWKTEFLKLNIFKKEIQTPVPINGYQHLYYMHLFVRIIFFIAIISFTVHSIAWLNDVVELPPPTGN